MAGTKDSKIKIAMFTKACTMVPFTYLMQPVYTCFIFCNTEAGDGLLTERVNEKMRVIDFILCYCLFIKLFNMM